MLKVIGILFTGLTLIVLLKQIKPEYAYLLRIAMTVAAMVFVITVLDNVLSEVTELASLPTGGLGYLTIAIKAAGICYLTQTGSDICRDCGESALATQVEFMGRIIIVMISLPVIKELLEFSVSLISK